MQCTSDQIVRPQNSKPTNIEAVLDEAGLRLLVIVFHARGCTACEQEAPHWKALRDEYALDGLRIYTVGMRGHCETSSWPSDKEICDERGDWARMFVPKEPPTAFVVSWRRTFLEKNASFDAVQRAVRVWRDKKALRVKVELSKDWPAGDKAIAQEVRMLVEQELIDRAKFVVVADEPAARKLKWEGLAHESYRDVLKIEPGNEIPPNARLGVSLAGDKLQLRIVSIDRNDHVCAGDASWRQNSENTAKDAVEDLLSRCRRSWPLLDPGRQSKDGARETVRVRPVPAPASKAVPRSQYRESHSDDNMVKIPAGEATIGCSRRLQGDCNADEGPRRVIRMDVYRIDRTEVTVDDYRRCVQDGACTTEGLRRETRNGRVLQRISKMCNWAVHGRARHPMNCVSWAQASAYCAWAGKRLPSDVEWEKAARGRSGLVYPWGPEPYDRRQRANIADEAARARFSIPEEDYAQGYHDGFETTAPVGSYSPAGDSPYGVQDMVGNVAEWSADWYKVGKKRSVRGGGWSSPPYEARTSERMYANPADRNGAIGFRCAR